MRWIIAISVILSISCGIKDEKKKSDGVERSMNQSKISESKLKKAVIYGGDKSAYDELSISYLDHSFQEEFLFYAIIMANRYDYPQAYFDVYYYLTQTFASDIGNMDESSANIAIEYLLKASKKGHHEAKGIIEEFSITSGQNSKQQIEWIFNK